MEALNPNYSLIVPAMQYFAALVYSGVAQNWVGAGYVGAGVVLYGLTWLVYLFWVWIERVKNDAKLEFTTTAFSIGSLTAFAVYWALFMWEQYGNNKATTMSVGIGVGYALTIAMIVASYYIFTVTDVALIGLMVLLGTGVAVGAYYATKAVEPNQNLYANPSSLTFLLAAILTPAVLGVSALLYGVTAGSSDGGTTKVAIFSEKIEPLEGVGASGPATASTIEYQQPLLTRDLTGENTAGFRYSSPQATASTRQNTESNDFRKQKVTNKFLNASESTILNQ